MSDSKPAAFGSEERFFIGIVMAVALLATLGGWLVVSYAHRHPPVGIRPDHDRALVDFVLTNQSGQVVTRADFDGKIVVVDFLLTSCTLTCREVNRHMAEIQQITTNQPDVRLISLTVDPRDDTVPVLAQYGDTYKADPRRWFLLTGERTILYHLIATSFLNQDLDDPFSYMPGNFSHTDRLALVDARGRVRAYFDGLNDDVAKSVTTAIAGLGK